MKDVAVLAGVGLATVSRVINGKSGVAPGLVDRVNEAARKLGYRHDVTARSLRRADRKTDTIGIVLENVANPFSSALHRAVEDVAENRGVLLLTGSNNEDPARERRLLQNFTERRVDGLIVVPTGLANDELLAARQRGTSIVCLDRHVELDDIDSVTVDNRGGVTEAVRHLHRLGHRRIAFLCDRTRIWTARERMAGYLAGLSICDLPRQTELIRADIHTEHAAEHAATELLALAPPPTAFISAQNLITVGTRRVLQDHHLEHQIALIGFDDFPLADMLTPQISVIAQDVTQLGRTAAELLFERLDGGHQSTRHVELPTSYIARGSGEIPPAPPGPHGSRR